eukprot:6682131-Ditylum_brightwellii.AAC.1
MEVLHQQLVLDMDWAVENAEGERVKIANDDGDGQAKQCTVIVMTKMGHRDAMKDLSKLINGK